jgi:hypothetical protein
MLTYKTLYVYVVIQFVVWSVLWETDVGLICNPTYYEYIHKCNGLRRHVYISHGCVKKNAFMIVCVLFIYLSVALHIYIYINVKVFVCIRNVAPFIMVCFVLNFFHFSIEVQVS